MTDSKKIPFFPCKVTIPYTHKDYLEKLAAERNKKPSTKRLEEDEKGVVSTDTL